MTVVTLKYECFHDILEVSLNYEDLTLILEDGKYRCNSFLCASVFPIFVDIFETSLEEPLVVSLPDFKCEEFSSFFSSIYNQKSELDVSQNIQYLLESAANDQELDNEIENIRDGCVLYKEYGDDPDEKIDMEEAGFCSDSDSASDKEEATPKIIRKKKDLTVKRRNRPNRVSSLAKENERTCDFGVIFNSKKKAEAAKKMSVSCSKCNRLFNSYSALFYHNHAEHGQAATCDVCGKVFQSRVHLKEHRNRTHKPGTTCTICGLVVKHMKQHLDNVHKSDCDKRFRCEYCNKSFNQSDKMKRHQMSVHLKLQPFKCRYGCGLAYNDRSNRNQHERKKHGRMAETSSVQHKPSVDIL